ncbi:glycosyltransferase family 9 protein [Pasteurellaceae bacterium LIM206]|nr:glycosyltransferase family 9 protein [Pasteurellaceae bacterium LIM206]
MSLKQLLQKYRIKLGKILLDKSSKDYNNKTAVKKILFLRQDGKIGDYIVSSFVFREIKKLYPDVFIGVVCIRQNKYLFEQNGYIDKLYVVKKRSISDVIKFGLEIRKQQYDAVIDPTLFVRNRDLLLLRLINATNYVGYKKSEYKIFNHNLEGEYHFSEVYQKALDMIGIHVQDTSYDVPENDQVAEEINKFLSINKITDFISINFYGAARIKKVSDENIVKYLRYLTEVTKGKNIVILTYPEVTEKLISLSKGFGNVFLYTKTNGIFHTIELIRHSDLLISTDTSTIHIASGFDKDIIGIYREDKIAFTHWRPKTKGSCHILFYKENINEISPEQILPEWLN